ncbi:hypothetical protein TSUD_214960 [Trifolium subterraneum]|uniref:Reverse transcriptase Ty1/copia-type domain-containing protein n=1 Tax=Trifolium subterraneum TaxID=3900 RepID=A0A2Z6N4N2_TRISU|nr:hypothetical protein TSUD_214960 [Trifolium subterraneum]
MAATSSSGSVHGGQAFGAQVLPQNKGYQNDILNPYFTHPNENPGNILATLLLSGPNYHSWSRAVTVTLRSKHKIHFINGSLPRPPDEDRDSIAWDRCNTMVMSWLSNSVEPEISQSILWMDTASEIWKELKERFYQGDVFRISDTQEEISANYTKMKKLWQELDNFRPIPESSYHDACQTIVKMRDYKDSDQVIGFLKGLNDNYSAVRSQIMLMEPLPNIGKVYSLLVQQERQPLLFSDESKILAASGYAANGRGSSYSRGRGERGGKPSYGRGRGKGNKVCTFCGMTNHVVDECFKKHGFPPHMHSKEDNGDKDTCKLFFTPDQHKTLLALLQNSNNMSAHSMNHITSHPSSSTGILCTTPLISKPNDSFILDTGATDHDTLSKRMIGAAKMHHGLYILTTPLTSPVFLPAKQPCQANQQYINALDTLDKDSVVKNKDRNNDCILWHMRFGHTSFDKLVEINKMFPFVKVSKTDFPCDDSQKNVDKSQSSSHNLHRYDDPFFDSDFYPLNTHSSHDLTSTPNFKPTGPSHSNHHTPSTSHHSAEHIPQSHTPSAISMPSTQITSCTSNPPRNEPGISPSSTTLPNNTIDYIPLRQSTRNCHPPPYLQDYYCNQMSTAIHDPSGNIQTSSTSELTALGKNNTWKLVPLPPHKHSIGCKWVFKLKLHANGTIERYKDRLVAKGYTQTEGIDYLDTFSPVVKMITIRMLLAIAASENWPLYQLDVNTAFLHGDLNEEVYMQPPPGLDLPQPNLVCKLQRSFYVQSKSDYSLFTKQASTGFTVILVYVDDLVLGGTDNAEIQNIKALLDAKFSIKDLGSIKYFMGFEVANTQAGISLCQRKYALDLIQDTGLLGAKPCNTPMQPHLQLHTSSVSKLSQFLAAPTNEHMLAGLHVLRLGSLSKPRRSTTGFCFFLGNSLISWKSKKQNVVSRSSSEAEYRALAQTTCEGQWLKFLLQDFHISHPTPIVIYCDNKSAFHIAANPVFHERTKHIEMDCHVVREKVQDGLIHLLPVPSKEQVADILTKSLHPGPFHMLHDKLGMIDIILA